MSGGRGRRGGHGGGGGGGGGHGGGDSRWLVTYADLLTLLMVLFLVLWVISTIDLAKFEKFKSGLGDFGNPAASAAGAGGGEGSTPCPTASTEAPAEGAAPAEGETATTEAPVEGETASTEAPPEGETATTEAPPETEPPATEPPATEPPATEAPAEGDTATAEAPAEGEAATTEAPAEGAAPAEGETATTEAPADPCLGDGDVGSAGTKGSKDGAGSGGGALAAGDLPKVAEEVQAAVAAAGLPDVIDVTITERGLVIIVTTDNVLFGSGSAEITPEGAAMIGVVAPTLNNFTNRIVVEGHTDKRPLRRTDYDNWDLSVDRAVSVIKLLRDSYAIDSDRLTAAGFGERRPVAEGDDDASLARNRRVEIVVLANPEAEIDQTADTTAPEGTTAPGEAPTGDTTAPVESLAPAETADTVAPAAETAAAGEG